MKALREKFKMLVNATDTAYIRNIHDTISWNDRLVGILGARGVGKSTLVLQHIKLHDNIDTSLYVSADDMWFSAHTLVELADSFYKDGGIALYVDEIHSYRNWSQEIKNIYDTYPGLRVVYTGSSVLDLQKGGYDLSRRMLEYQMPGLSFREYLALSRNLEIPVHTLDQIISNNIDFPYSGYRPLALFKEYLRTGFYPYFKNGNYYLRLGNVINRVVEQDIPKFAGLSVSTAGKLKTLLYIIAQSVPFKPNYSKIGKDLDMHRNYVADIVVWLEKAGLVNVLRDDTKGISLLGKVNKIYLNNPNIAYVLSDSEPDIGNIRETIFLEWMRASGHNVTSSPVADFKAGKYTFEIGGKNKGQKQISGTDNAYIVKDDIEYGSNNVIPLWAFGLMY